MFCNENIFFLFEKIDGNCEIILQAYNDFNVKSQNEIFCRVLLLLFYFTFFVLFGKFGKINCIKTSKLKQNNKITT